MESADTSKPEPEASPDDFSIELSQPLEEALADIPEPDGPGGRVPITRPAFRAIEGGLASLFGKRAPAPGNDDDKRQPDFDDLLEDSFEDQELRRKLAAGMSARVR